MKRYGEIQAVIIERAGIRRGQTILDAGTGPETLLAIRLAEVVRDSGEVVAIDREQNYAPAILSAIERSDFCSRISFVLADLRYIPLKGSSVDAAVSLDTVQDMYGNDEGPEVVVRQYIYESVRVVRSGGNVIVATRYPVPSNKAQEVYLRLRLLERELEHVLWKERARYYTDSELVSLFEDAGLEGIKKEIVEHNVPYPKDNGERNLLRIRARLLEVQDPGTRTRIEEELRTVTKDKEQYGEDFLPTLLVAGVKE